MEKENQFNFFSDFKKKESKVNQEQNQNQEQEKKSNVVWMFIHFGIFQLAVIQGYMLSIGVENKYSLLFTSIGLASGARFLNNLFNINNKKALGFIGGSVAALVLMSGFINVRDFLFPFAGVFLISGLSHFINKVIAKIFKSKE